MQATATSRRLQELEHGQDKALKEARAAATRNQNEAEQLTQRLADSEAEKAELRSDHSAETAGFAISRKELEVRTQQL